MSEAAVCGGIPIIEPLKRSLKSNSIKKMVGIINGTTNFILSKMTNEKADYKETLKLAQSLGYAEFDPLQMLRAMMLLIRFQFLVNLHLEEKSQERRFILRVLVKLI